MPIERSIFSFFNIDAQLVTKIFIVLFLVFYNVFAFVLFRQIQLMCSTLPTPATPLLKFVAIVHFGVSLALLLVVVGLF